jgi:uncharacterized protein
MVQINVSQLLNEPIGSTRNYRVNEVVDISGSNSLVQGEIRLMRTDRSILAKGTLCADVELTCSRCLSFFNCALALNIEEEYSPTTDTMTGALLPLNDETGFFTIDGHNILDLTEAIRQYALMAIPMKPLCDEDCGGLCPTCGCNRNQAPCDCPAEPVDPRWSELGKLVLVDSRASVSEQKGTN